MLEITKTQTLAYKEGFYTELKRHGIAISTGRVPVSISPYLISVDRYHRLQYLCEQVLAAIEILLREYINSSELQVLFPELARYRFLSLRAPTYPHWVHLARFDIAVTAKGEFQLMETNCDCPGAITWTAVIKQLYETLPLFQQHIKPLMPIAQSIDHAEYFIKSLIKAYQHNKASNQLPTITFLSSLYRPILTDMNLLDALVKKMGLTGGHSPVQHLTIKNGRVACGNYSIDIVYQKFDAYIDEQNQVKPCIYDQSPDEVAAYWQGLQANQFEVFNSFPSSMVAENKRILYLLNHPDLQSLFTLEQQQAIKDFCPKTFPLLTNLKLSETIKEVVNNKNNYVLKRTIDTQGRGVILGCQSTPSAWSAYLQQAIDRPYVMQAYIPQPMDYIYSESIDSKPMAVFSNLSMFMIAGKASGLICRSSPERITNVSRVGSLRVVYVIP